MIDYSTTPKCNVQIRLFEWGESYETFDPIFEIEVFGNSEIEKSIHFFGKNNFKIQLLSFYNALLNFEEGKIYNFEGEIENRNQLISFLELYIQNNKDLLSPWEKYSEFLNENDYIEFAESLLDFNLCKILII